MHDSNLYSKNRPMVFSDTEDLQRSRRRLKESIDRLDVAREILNAINPTSIARTRDALDELSSLSNSLLHDLFSTCEELTRRYHEGDRLPTTKLCKPARTILPTDS